MLVLPVKVSYQIATALGSIYYWLAKNDREIAKNNLKVVLNQTDDTPYLRYICRMIFVNFALYLVEFFRTAKVDLKFIQRCIQIEGQENLDEALKLGKGVLLVSAHLGNWELGAMVLSVLGYKVNMVAWTHQDKLVNDFFLEQRRSKGLQVIPLGTSIRHVFTALKNNENVAILGDIDYLQPQAGITVKFFGRDTVMPKGPAIFSLKTGAPIVPTWLVREKENRFRLILRPPIIYQPTGEEDNDLTKLTEKVAQAIESFIVKYPAQWFMLTPRW